MDHSPSQEIEAPETAHPQLNSRRLAEFRFTHERPKAEFSASFGTVENRLRVQPFRPGNVGVQT